MQTSENGIRFIESFEGFSAQPYSDLAGFNTIGYGHRIRPGELLSDITEAQAAALLKADLAETEAAINRLVIVTLTQNQFDALTSFTYNLGSERLQTSTLLRLLNSGNYAGAAEQFPRWSYIGTSENNGLHRRRKAEQALFLTA